MHILANSEGADEILLSRSEKEIHVQYYLEIITCKLIIYTMDHHKIIVSNNPLVHKGLTLSLPNFWGNVLLSAKYILGNVTTEGQAV